MTTRLSQLPAADHLDGKELVEVSQLSSTVTLAASTISFAASDDSLNDSASGFITAGFTVGKSLNIAGSASNDMLSTVILSVTADKIVVNAALTDEAAGAGMTLTQWDSKRTTSGTVSSELRATVDLVDAATVDVPADVANNFRLLLEGNRMLGNPSGMRDGQRLTFRITQDTTGGRTLVYGSKYKFAGGVAPTLSTAGDAQDWLTCQYDATEDTLFCTFMGDML